MEMNNQLLLAREVPSQLKQIFCVIGAQSTTDFDQYKELQCSVSIVSLAVSKFSESLNVNPKCREKGGAFVDKLA